MPDLVLPTPTKSKLRRTITAIGDSLTDNISLGNLGSEFWPTQLEGYLNQTDTILDGLAPQPPQTAKCKCRNFGQSGRTSGPYAAGKATCNTVTSSTNITLTSTSGTIAAGMTILVNGSMAQIATWNSGTGVATLNTALPGSLTSGNNYPCYLISVYGADILSDLNFVMGNKTPKALDLLYQYGSPEWDPPDIAAIWIGYNDPGQTYPIVGLNLNTTIKTAPSLSAPQWPLPSAGGTTLIPLQTGQGGNATIGQAVAIVDWTQSPPRVWVGLVNNVAGDTIYVSQNLHAMDYTRTQWINTMSGGASPLTGPGFPPIGASVYQGTQANIMAAVLLLNQYAGVSKFLIGNTHYLNYSAGGDTLATPATTDATLRTFQAAAVTLLQAQGINAQLVDIYTYMRNLINNGSTYSYRQTVYAAVQGDHAWHFIDSNPHLNALGNSIVATAFLGALQSAGWVDALRP